MGKNIDKRVWGVLGKQQTYFSPQKQVEGKTKTPLNANAFDSWDAKRSRFKRIDGYNVSDAAQQGGVVPQTTATPVVSPSPSSTPQPTPSFTPTQTQTNTPTPTSTPEIDCIWNLTDELWENNSNLWNVCQPVITPTQTQTNTSTPTNTPTNTNTPTPSTTPPPASGTTEAQAYLAAVLAAGGSFDSSGSTVSAATITLFTSLVSNNLWDKMVAFYPYLGGTSGGCAINGKTPGTYNITWNGGMTFSSGGAIGNGTNGYGNTGLVPSTSLSVNNTHVSFYSNSNSIGTGSMMGCLDAGSKYITVFPRETGNVFEAKLNDNTYSSFSNSNSDGYYVWTRTASNVRVAYENGIQLGTDSIASIGLPAINMYVFGHNNSGTAQAFTSRRMTFQSIGFGLTSGQTSTLSTIINTFQTSLGRNVY